MKNLLFVLLLFIGSNPIAAQFGLFLQPDTKSLVFGDKVNVRESPNKDGKELAQLLIGDVVTVLDTTPQYMTQNGRRDYWYKIKFSGNKIGYLWGGLISYGGDTLLQKDIKFVYNFTEVKKRKDSENQDITIEVRAVKNGNMIAKTAFVIENINENNLTSSSIDVTGGGLNAIKSIISINIGYPACGYPHYDILMLWDGTQFTTLPKLESIGDAGAFGYSEKYIFPNNFEEGSVEDKIIYEIHHYQVLDNGEEGESNEYKVRRILKRKGQQYVKPKMPEAKF